MVQIIKVYFCLEIKIKNIIPKQPKKQKTWQKIDTNSSLAMFHFHFINFQIYSGMIMIWRFGSTPSETVETPSTSLRTE